MHDDRMAGEGGDRVGTVRGLSAENGFTSVCRAVSRCQLMTCWPDVQFGYYFLLPSSGGLMLGAVCSLSESACCAVGTMQALRRAVPAGFDVLPKQHPPLSYFQKVRRPQNFA